MTDEIKSDLGLDNLKEPMPLYLGKPDVADTREARKKAGLDTVDTLALAKEARSGEVQKASLRDLSTKSRCFLELLVAGKSTLEAYELAGFKGSKHAAYQIRSDLRHHLAGMLESHGVSREDVKIELLKLLKLPTEQATVDVNTKLKLLRFMDKLTEGEQVGKPKITPFEVTIQTEKVERMEIKG